MTRPFDKHIDEQELRTLVSSGANAGQESPPPTIREAQLHLELCGSCSRKVSEYRQLVTRSSNVVVEEAARPGRDCPKDSEVDWHEVAAGLWPELKVKQLIMHAARCEHCGPLLRAATSVDEDATAEEQQLLAQLRAPVRPVVENSPDPMSSNRRHLAGWRQILGLKVLVPALSLMLIIAMIATRRLPRSLSQPDFAEFAVSTHQQHAEGQLALELQSNSKQVLNEWLTSNSPFTLSLPSPRAPAEERSYQLEGARFMKIGSSTAAYIAYHLPTGPASLLVTPDSVAIASGGVEVHFQKVNFHYRLVNNHKVVTWSVHGLTYALVSQEGTRTQQSCMVCHSAMRDRDLSQTPTPLIAGRSAPQPAWH
jgi:hypothetical protein